MAQRLLKADSGKVVAKPVCSRIPRNREIVLVGTYKENQLEWINQHGIYNYPVRDDDEFDAETFAKIKELWLYADGKSTHYAFAAEFVGKMMREEFLAANPTYADIKPSSPLKKAKSANKAYYVFKTTPIIDDSLAIGNMVVVRFGDFESGRNAKIKNAIAQYKAYGEFAPLSSYLPSNLAQVPREQLCVCEAALQLNFLNSFFAPASVCENVTFCKSDIVLECGDSLELCDKWDSPTVIVSDGPYGLASYPGDPPTPEGLAEFYRPFLEKWYRHANTSATLWFWNSEQGWANCHRVIEECGWKFRNCHIWDKGMSHVAGNCNTKTIRKYPVVTEVCAQYVRKNYLKSQGVSLSLRDWMREEWKRTALPFRLTNVACGVKDAATRKYFSSDHLWYFPPAEAFVRIAAYANTHGKVEGRPFFAREDGGQFTEAEWELMRAKFHCEIGVSNVWNFPAVRGEERIKMGGSCLHMNQKPLVLLERIIRSSSDVGDVVWEPFGGLCSTAIAAYHTCRKAFAAEINPVYFNAAKERLNNE